MTTPKKPERCAKHPRYKGARPPRVVCPDCCELYDELHPNVPERLFHFSVGDSGAGPIGLAGNVAAKTAPSAVIRFRALLTLHTDFEDQVQVFDEGRREGYADVYLNTKHIGLDDIDEVYDVTEEKE